MSQSRFVFSRFFERQVIHNSSWNNTRYCLQQQNHSQHSMLRLKSTPFFGDRSCWFTHTRTCSVIPCRPVNGRCFFSRQMFYLFFFRWCPKFPAKTKKRLWVDRGSQNTCVKCQDLSPRKSVDMLTFAP